MTFAPCRYIPCLRWKLGEYQALADLSSIARSIIMPLIDVSEIGFDFATGENKKSVDDHLKQFAKRVTDNWGKDKCFIDMHLINDAERMATCEHPVTFIFNDLRSKGAQAIPVMAINQDSQWQSAIQQVADQDNRGFCLRISLEEAANSRLGKSIQELLEKFNKRVEQCDLIIDERAPNFEPLDGFVSMLETIIRNLPYLNQWRSFALIGTSFPSSLSILKSNPQKIIPRNEWRAYKQLFFRLRSSGIRIPNFGDYAINHPEVSTADPRVMKTTANIRYTINDNWLVVRGKVLRDYGFEQHRDLCKMIERSNLFEGPGFSVGDKYIFDCSRKNVSPGNSTTWRRVGTNHHLEAVARDVANLAAS